MSNPAREFQPDRSLTVKEAAAFLQVSESWLNKARVCRSWTAFHQNGPLGPLQPAGA